MEFDPKNFREIDLFDFTSFFLAQTFLNFLVRCGLEYQPKGAGNIQHLGGPRAKRGPICTATSPPPQCQVPTLVSKVRPMSINKPNKILHGLIRKKILASSNTMPHVLGVIHKLCSRFSAGPFGYLAPNYERSQILPYSTMYDFHNYTDTLKF